MTTAELEKALLNVAKDCIEQGPGYAQETVVIREAIQKLALARDLKQQQRVLTAWHDLFRNGTLSWGYNIDNPTSPFFHFAER